MKQQAITILVALALTGLAGGARAEPVEPGGSGLPAAAGPDRTASIAAQADAINAAVAANINRTLANINASMAGTMATPVTASSVIIPGITLPPVTIPSIVVPPGSGPSYSTSTSCVNGQCTTITQQNGMTTVTTPQGQAYSLNGAGT
jgi:hypothetical protein